MTDVAIRVDNLSKRYHIGKPQQRFDSLGDALAGGLRRPLARLRHRGRERATAAGNTIWALKDISFEVKRGEVVGIIGRNGAGKSTLLKILSQITEPTAGRAIIRGRVGSLLEVGTGFHPELTGRENIYLNGAILGMTRAEIARKFDEIVAFAEIERFLDTPVKRYSSGMYVRLAFAVAAHLEPEILLVDEVLAVGDIQFQTKCLGKIGQVATEGRTVLFVSHNMGPIQVLCTRGVWLRHGQVASSGPIASVVAAYLGEFNQSAPSHPSLDAAPRTGTGAVRFTDLRLLNTAGTESAVYSLGDTLIVEMSVRAFEQIRNLELSLLIKTITGTNVAHVIDRDDEFALADILPGSVTTVRCSLPELRLYPGRYLLSVWAGDFTHDFDYLVDVTTFTVVQSGFATRTSDMSQSKGLVLLPCSWHRVAAVPAEASR